MYQTTLVNRNITVNGRRTSIRLETPFWDALQSVAKQRNQTVNDLVSQIAAATESGSLTSAVRVFVLRAGR